MTLRRPSLPNNGQPLALASENTKTNAGKMIGQLKSVQAKLSTLERSASNPDEVSVWNAARELIEDAITRLTKLK